MRAVSKIAIAAGMTLSPLVVRADEGSPVRTSVEVDTSQVGESGPVIQRRIRERGDVILRHEGVLPARDAQDPVIVVTVSELGGDDPGFAFELRAQRAGQDVLHSERFECRLCTETELVTQVESRLASIVGELGKRVQASDDGPAEREDPAVVSPLPATSDAAKLGSMGKVGVGVLVTGVVGVGVGIGLAIRKDRPKAMATDLLSTKQPGYALIGVGAALAVTGAVLLLVDRKGAQKRAAFAPWLGPEGAGLTFAGRFSL